MRCRDRGLALDAADHRRRAGVRAKVGTPTWSGPA